jgi:integrase
VEHTPPEPPRPAAAAAASAAAAEDESRAPTLAAAIAAHVRAMQHRRASPRSIATLVEETRRHLFDWFERPLATLRRHEVADRHEHLTSTSGPYVANRVLAQFRAVWNTAARRHEHVPATPPTIAVTFNRVERRREPIPWRELVAWRTKVARLRNPVRRDLQHFLLFTGLRSLDARTVRWEHVSFAHELTEHAPPERARWGSAALAPDPHTRPSPPTIATLHRPSPKGGPRRAFTIPLARAVAALLERRRLANADLFAEHGGDHGFVFPTVDRRGRVTHVQEPKQQRTVRRVTADGAAHLAKVTHLPSPHRLRDTFATAAHEVGVNPLDLKVLMNHALPHADDVTQGYIRPSLAHLSASAEAIAAFLLRHLGASDG